jgi:hypothetical protein
MVLILGMRWDFQMHSFDIKVDNISFGTIITKIIPSAYMQRAISYETISMSFQVSFLF